MSWLLFMSIVSLFLSLLGNILVNYKMKIGFLVWIASNISWIAVNFIGETNYPQIIMFFVYVCLNTQGYVLWSKKNQ